MQTNFSSQQLKDPQMAATEQVLRTCVHCGFCTATCPTYQLLGDELDSPRGRIYLMKDMFEKDAPASKEVVQHIDRCLSCLSCMSTCPSGVNYMHLVDHGREHIENTYKRPFFDRLLRSTLALLIPNPRLFRLALTGAWFARPLRHITSGRLRAMLELAPSQAAPRAFEQDQNFHPATGAYKGRVALSVGCAQKVVAPEINTASIRLLNRLGYDVVIPKQVGCCGAVTHHMGKTSKAHASAIANIAGWLEANRQEKLDAIIVNTSGCGTTIKDYGFMLRNDAEMADDAAKVSALAKDISEFLDENNLIPKLTKKQLAVTYHSACSLQHGQQIKTAPVALLKKAGFKVSEVPMGHLCCGSAGTYNILQPEIAAKLRDQKIENIDLTNPQIIAAGNVGCITQISNGTQTPVVHTVELLDWATGGPMPSALTTNNV